MRSPTRAIILFVASTALAACERSSPTTLPVTTGVVSFTTPAGGETFAIGDTVTLVWTCAGCGDTPAGDFVQVSAFDGVDAYLLGDNAQLTDSASWVVGTSLQGGAVLPGFYVMFLRDALGYYAAESRFFQVAAAP